MPSFFAPDYVHLTRHHDDSRATLTSASLDTSDEGTVYTVDDVSAASAIPIMEDGSTSSHGRRQSRVGVGDELGRPQHAMVEQLDETRGPSVFIMDVRKTGFWRQRTKMEKGLLFLVLVSLVGFIGVLLILATSQQGEPGFIKFMSLNAHLRYNNLAKAQPNGNVPIQMEREIPVGPR